MHDIVQLTLGSSVFFTLFMTLAVTLVLLSRKIVAAQPIRFQTPSHFAFSVDN
jgi:hypothetical protein